MSPRPRPSSTASASGLAMRRIDTITGRIDMSPVPCGSTPGGHVGRRGPGPVGYRWPNAAQGWHSRRTGHPTGPNPTGRTGTHRRPGRPPRRLRPPAAAVRKTCRTDPPTRGRARYRTASNRSTRPTLPARPPTQTGQALHPATPRRPGSAPRPVDKRTVGRVFAGRYRPSMFLTLTLDSYGRVDSDGAAVDPDRYDYRRAARDAIHFPALLDRFWQNTRRCVGLGGAVLRHRRAPKTRCPALPCRDPGRDPPGGAAGHHRSDLPPGVVARP